MGSLVSLWRIVHAGQSAPDAVVYAQRAAPVGSGVRNCGSATFLTVRGVDGPQSFLAVPRSPKAPMLAGSLASAVGGRHEGVDALPELELGGAVARLVACPARYAARDTQAGRDPGEVALFIGANMPVGAWLAVTLRAPGRGEVRVARRWFRHRLAGANTHYSLAKDPLLASFTVGGVSVDELEGFLSGLVAVLPGFDLETDVRPVTGRTLGSVASVGAGAAAGAGSFVLADDWRISAALGTAGVVAGAVAASGVVPSERDRLLRVLRHGRFPSPARRSPWLVGAPRQARTDPDGVEVAASGGSYPLARTVFLVGPAQVAAIACPHFGTVAGASANRARQVPAVLTRDIGPLVGWADGDVPVHVSAGDVWSSVFICGIGGSGKTVAVNNLFAFDSLERVAPSGKPGRPGKANALVVFENKGADGVMSYLEWLKVTGDRFVLADLADPGSAAISMLPDRGTVEERAAVFVAQMVYAFGEASIAYRSQNTLRQVLALALLATDEDAAGAGLAGGLSFVEFADVLLGSRGDQAGVSLYQAIVARSIRMADGPDREVLRDCLARVEPLYGAKVTAAARRSLVEAPASKIAILASVPSWWRPSRPHVSFDQIISRHWCVVINTGSPLGDGVLADDAVTGHVSAMLMYLLRRTIQQHCNGWRAQGRSVTIFSDELSLLAGSSPEVFTWLRNQGRSFGVRQVLATQYPEQLAPEVRMAVMGAGTTVWFQQNEPSVIASAVADLTKDGSDWQSADLAGMARWHAVVRATVEGQPQPAVVARMGYWVDDRDRFVTDQGYPPMQGR